MWVQECTADKDHSCFRGVWGNCWSNACQAAKPEVTLARQGYKRQSSSRLLSCVACDAQLAMPAALTLPPYLHSPGCYCGPLQRMLMPSEKPCGAETSNIMIKEVVGCSTQAAVVLKSDVLLPVRLKAAPAGTAPCEHVTRSLHGCAGLSNSL